MIRDGIKGDIQRKVLYHLPINKSLLNIPHVPGTILGTGKELMSTSDMAPALRKLTI